MTQEEYGVSFTKNRAKILAVCRTKLYGLPNEIDDALSDAYYKGAIACEKFDETRAFLPWIYKITRNVCNDKLREVHKKVERQSTDADLELVLFTEEDKLHTLKIEVDDCREKRLSDEEWQCFQGRMRGESWEGIGCRLSIPASTVRVRYASAHKKLKNCLAVKGIVNP